MTGEVDFGRVLGNQHHGMFTRTPGRLLNVRLQDLLHRDGRVVPEAVGRLGGCHVAAGLWHTRPRVLVELLDQLHHPIRQADITEIGTSSSLTTQFILSPSKKRPRHPLAFYQLALNHVGQDERQAWACEHTGKHDIHGHGKRGHGTRLTNHRSENTRFSNTLSGRLLLSALTLPGLPGLGPDAAGPGETYAKTDQQRVLPRPKPTGLAQIAHQ